MTNWHDNSIWSPESDHCGMTDDQIADAWAAKLDASPGDEPPDLTAFANELANDGAISVRQHLEIAEIIADHTVYVAVGYTYDEETRNLVEGSDRSEVGRVVRGFSDDPELRAVHIHTCVVRLDESLAVINEEVLWDDDGIAMTLAGALADQRVDDL